MNSCQRRSRVARLAKARRCAAWSSTGEPSSIQPKERRTPSSPSCSTAGHMNWRASSLAISIHSSCASARLGGSTSSTA